jgi:hypothetical protein
MMSRTLRGNGLRVFVAENLGAMKCGTCGRMLSKSEVESVWRLHWSPPLCFDCQPTLARSSPEEIEAERAGELLH